MNVTKCLDLLFKRIEIKIWMQSDMLLRQRGSSSKGTVIGQELLAYYQQTKFAPLYRINYRSHRTEFVSDL